MGKKHRVVLTNDQRRRLQLLVSQGSASPRTLTRAQILLLADAQTGDEAIAGTMRVSAGRFERVRKRFAEDGWEAAIEDRQRSGSHCCQPEVGRAGDRCSGPPGSQPDLRMAHGGCT